MRAHALRLPVLLALLALSAPARADDLDVNLRANVPAGRTPALLVTAHKEITRLEVTLTRSDGERRVLRRDRLPLGEEVALELAQPQGRFGWTGTLAVDFAAGGGGEMPLSFETVVAGAMDVRSSATREDVLAGRARVVVDRALQKATVETFGLGGARLAVEEVGLAGHPAGRPVELAWSPPTGEVLRVKATLTDTDGLTGGIEWLPWEVAIPHEEVVFDTGRAEVRADQAPKLEAVLGELRAALAKYGPVAEVQLYVAGHTDTVGSAAANQRLSEARALAIARWFRGRGIRVPIYYRGFGEGALAVGTPDETDEPQNRRAEYVVAGEDPFRGRDLPGTWKGPIGGE